MPEYVDDSTILDDDELWRRIPNWPNFVVYDENRNIERVSSVAFKDHRNGTPMSVAIASIARQHGRGSIDLINDNEAHEGFGVVSLNVGNVRELNQGVMKEPIEGQPEHGEVFDKSGQRSKKTQKALAQSAAIIIAPEPPAEESND